MSFPLPLAIVPKDVREHRTSTTRPKLPPLVPARKANSERWLSREPGPQPLLFSTGPRRPTRNVSSPSVRLRSDSPASSDGGTTSLHSRVSVRRSRSLRDEARSASKLLHNLANASRLSLGIWDDTHSTDPLSSSSPPPLASARDNAEFHRLFPDLSETDKLVNDFACAWNKEGLLIQGRMWVSQKHVCFKGWTSSSVFALRFREIVVMEKRTIALVFSNSIEVEMEDGTKHFFASFFNRDQTFRVLRASWDAELEPCSCDGLGTCPTCFAKITRDRSTKKPSDDTTPSPIKSLGKTNLTRPLSSTSISSTDSQLTMVDGVQNAHLLPTPPLTPFADDVDMPEMEYVKALTADVKREVLGGTSHGHKTNDGEKGKDSMTRLPNKLEKASSHSTTAPAAAPTGQHTWHLPTIPTLPTFPIALPTSIPLPIPILTLPSPRQLALLSALTLFAVSLIALGLQSVALYRVLGVLEKVEGRLVSVE